MFRNASSLVRRRRTNASGINGHAWPYLFFPFGSDVGSVERNGRYRQVLLARGRFEFDHEFSRYSPTLFHLYALGFGPFTDLGGVQAAR